MYIYIYMCCLHLALTTQGVALPAVLRGLDRDRSSVETDIML